MMAGSDIGYSTVVTGHFHVPAQRGFTLVELILVMVVTGILGAVAATRFFDRDGFDADAFVERARTTLRYGQKLAIAQGRPVYVTADTTRVSLCFANTAACAAADRVPAPGGSNSGAGTTLASCANASNWACEGVPSGVAFGASPATTFYFDGLGKPFAASDAVDGISSTFAELVLPVTAAGATRNITIAVETGYVH